MRFCRDQAGCGVRLLQRSHHTCMRNRNVYAWLERRSRTLYHPLLWLMCKAFSLLTIQIYEQLHLRSFPSCNESSIIMRFHNQSIASETKLTWTQQHWEMFSYPKIYSTDQPIMMNSLTNKALWGISIAVIWKLLWGVRGAWSHLTLVVLSGSRTSGPVHPHPFRPRVLHSSE